MRSLERLFNCQELMDSIANYIINVHWNPQVKNQSYLWSAVSYVWSSAGDNKKDMLIHRTTEMI
jgi:hypothetical protein